MSEVPLCSSAIELALSLLPELDLRGPRPCQREWYVIAEQPAPAPHLAHPEGCAALRGRAMSSLNGAFRD